MNGKIRLVFWKIWFHSINNNNDDDCSFRDFHDYFQTLHYKSKEDKYGRMFFKKIYICNGMK